MGAGTLEKTPGPQMGHWNYREADIFYVGYGCVDNIFILYLFYPRDFFYIYTKARASSCMNVDLLSYNLPVDFNAAGDRPANRPAAVRHGVTWTSC